MKFVIQLTLMFCLFPSLSEGQKIRFTDTTNVWRVRHYSWENLPNTQIKGYASGIYKIDSLEYLSLSKTLIREDTIEGKVYCKNYGGSPNLDTTEQVLYNYHWMPGDTIVMTYYLNDTNRHYVAKLDSVVIGGVYHKIWDIRTVSGNAQGSYRVIEGIGSTGGPTFPFYPVSFEQTYRLICFESQGTFVTVPGYSFLPKNYQGDYLSPAFCAVGVTEAKSIPRKMIIVANQASSGLMIEFGETIREGVLLIYDIQGRIIERRNVEGSASLPIDTLPCSGMYFYSFYDIGNGLRKTGKFVYH